MVDRKSSKPGAPRDDIRSQSRREERVITVNATSSQPGSKPRRPATAPRPGYDTSFPPQYRLKTSADFAHLDKEGKRLYSSGFLLVVAPSMTGESRLGIAVTRKLDKRAVVRNKIKRRVREIFRASRARFKTPCDILVIARREALQSAYSDMERQILGALHHHGYLD